jgi:hypothetical protein
VSSTHFEELNAIFPSTHLMHLYDPSVSATLSASHLLQVEALSLPEYVPTAQFMQMVPEEPPTPAPYLPTIQLAHASDPDTSLNFPAVQCVQDPALGPVKPGLQVQTALPAGALEFVGHIVHVVAPTAPEYELTAQATQGPAPVAFLNVPTSQGVQIPPIAPQ